MRGWLPLRAVRRTHLIGKAGLTSAGAPARDAAHRTAMRPLQYQKRLRLLEARQMMLVEMRDAVNTAYGSAMKAPLSCREYARVFGNPPGRDIQRLMSAYRAHGRKDRRRRLRC